MPALRKVQKYDCIRQSEITLVLNEKDEVVGVEVYYFEPVNLLDFSLERLLSPPITGGKIKLTGKIQPPALMNSKIGGCQQCQ